MAKLVFCDVEGTLLTESFPGMVIAQGRAMKVFSPAQMLQVGALSAVAKVLPGKLQRTTQMIGVVRAIAGLSIATSDRVLDETMPHVLSHLKPEIVARLQAHQRDGYQLVLISAGLHEGIMRLAQSLGGRGEGTKMIIRDGRYIGKLDGPACQGKGKALRARAVMAELGANPDECIAYGDTSSDIPYLSLVGQAYAVDPDVELRAEATQRGWPIVTTSEGTSSAAAANAIDSDVEAQAQAAYAQFVTPRRMPLRDRDKDLMARGTPVALPNGLVATAWGEGPTVLLVHGWEGRGTSFAAFIEPLTAAGLRVVALDLPAHGDSRSDTTDPMDSGLAVLAAGQALGPLAGIVAHSFGAAATAIAIAKGLQVDRAVLIAGISSPTRVTQRFAAMLNLSPAAAERYFALMAERVGVTSDEIDVSRLSANFTMPALIFHDPEDAEVPFFDAEANVAAWPGAELRITEGRGHRRILLAPEVISETVSFISHARQPA